MAALGAVLVAVVVATAATHRPPARPATPAALSAQSMAVVATVNGHSVPVRELELFLAQERAATFAYFQQHFGADDHPGFWTTSYGGQTPRDYLGKLALADATRTTVQQDLAHKYNLLADSGYAAFLQSWTAENARRALAVTRNQPVYGPVHYSEANYFTYLFDQMATDLQTALVKDGSIAASDSALHQYYLAHRSQYPQQATDNSQGTVVAGPSTSAAAAPFEQVKAQVAQDYEHEQYTALVGRLADAASVSVNTAVLSAVPTN